MPTKIIPFKKVLNENKKTKANLFVHNTWEHHIFSALEIIMDYTATTEHTKKSIDLLYLNFI